MPSDAMPPSLWVETAMPGPVLSRLEGRRRSEVAIIGGGFTGLSAALHLAMLGREVVLLEAHDIGWGASGRNGGQVNPGLKYGRAALQRLYGETLGRAMYDTAADAPAFLFSLIRRHGIACDALQAGTLRLAHTEASLAGLHDAHRTLAAEGHATRLLDAGEVATATGTSRYLAGLLDPRGGHVQPLSLCRGLARAALDAGATLHVHSRATSLRREGDTWHIATSGGEVLARQVLLATDGYTESLKPGLQQTILPVNSFQIATSPLPAAQRELILPGRPSVFDSRRLILYFRLAGDRLVLGGRASFSVRDNRPADYAVMRQVLEGLYPQLSPLRVDHAWAGRVSITRDRLPHLWEVEPGLHAALGYNGRGVAMAVRLGAIAAERIAEPARAIPFPTSPAPRFPGHRARQPVLHAAMLYHRLMDSMGR